MDGVFSISRVEVNAQLVLSQTQSFTELIVSGGSIRGSATSIIAFIFLSIYSISMTTCEALLHKAWHGRQVRY